jgi:2-octaprenyl-6-methoxyphenol hydroxylase
MTQKPLQCDVLIVGGGPVGGVLVGLLTTLPLRVVVVDFLAPEKALDKNQDGRTTAVSWGSSLIMEKTGLWTQLLPHATPIEEIRVSQALTSGFLHFNQEDADGHPMGFILDNWRLRQALYTMMEERENITLIAPASVKSLECDASQGQAELTNGQLIQFRLIVGADGRLSQIRESVGIKAYTARYDQTAIVTSVQHEQPHHCRAFEHFLPTGPLAFLPVRTHQSSVVWSLQNKWIPAIESLSQEEFAQELERRFPYLGKIELISKRWHYPLVMTLPRRMTTERCVLMGDAAHAIHPIAGQGANLGFRDAEILSGLVQNNARLGLDIGEETLLKRYQRRRVRDIVSMTCMTDSLVRLFSRSSQSLGFVRGQGMSWINTIAPLRRRLTRHAMGLGL